MEKKFCRVDENSMTKVILTKHGADVVNDYNNFLVRYASANDAFKTDYVEDDSYVAELWVIMKVFYGEFNKGATEKCFKEIMVGEKE